MTPAFPQVSGATGGTTRLPTVEDVARAAQVSRQTVSNVLNTPEIVKLATRERVEAAIAELGYRPNLSARRLRQRKSATLGIRLDPEHTGVSGGVLDRFLHALVESADRRSMRVLLFTADDADGEIEQIRRLRDGADVDAFVLTSTFHLDPRTEWLTAHGVPFVTFGRPWGMPPDESRHLWVDIDGRQGTYDATIHLLDRGLTRIFWIGWPSPSGTGDDRRSGWEDAMRERLGSTPAELERLSAQTREGATQASEVVTAILAAGHAPEAIVCASDTLALGAMIAATAANQQDLPVIGFDDTPLVAALGISSVAQPLGEVAGAMLDLLLGPSGNTVVNRELRPDEAHRLIRPQLVVRAHNYLPVHGIDSAAADAAGNHP